MGFSRVQETMQRRGSGSSLVGNEGSKGQRKKWKSSQINVSLENATTEQKLDLKFKQSEISNINRKRESNIELGFRKRTKGVGRSG